MQHWFETTHLVEINEISVIVRILLSVFFGGILGFERTRKGRPAGMRTYMLVSLASCLVMLSGLYLFDIMGPGFDPARMAAQVLSGIGFLGAGTIMVTRYRSVKGLTTAAGLFTAACMGLAVGNGFYFGAFVTLLVCILIMVFADRFERAYISGRKRMHISFILSDLDGLKHFYEHLKAEAVRISDLDTFPVYSAQGFGVSCTVMLPCKKNHKATLEEFSHIPGVIFIEELEI